MPGNCRRKQKVAQSPLKQKGLCCQTPAHLFSSGLHFSHSYCKEEIKQAWLHFFPSASSLAWDTREAMERTGGGSASNLSFYPSYTSGSAAPVLRDFALEDAIGPAWSYFRPLNHTQWFSYVENIQCMACLSVCPPILHPPWLQSTASLPSCFHFLSLFGSLQPDQCKSVASTSGISEHWANPFVQPLFSSGVFKDNMQTC